LTARIGRPFGEEMIVGQRRLVVIMDPIADIHPRTDSTLALLLEAQGRGWELRYGELPDIWFATAKPSAA
jgi:glutathione synthase